MDGRPSKPDYYTLPLGSSALDDGILVVKTLQRQMEENRDHYRVIPAGSVFKGRNDSSLAVTMEISTSSKSFSGSLLHWMSWQPTPFIRIRIFRFYIY